MTSHGTAAEDSGLEMAPHHARLIEKFFDPSSKKVILLRSDPGMGKGNALVALAARLLGEEPAARILFLVPALMRSQFQERFLRAGIPAVILDRYRFREMVDSEPPENFWPRGSLMILSLDFAKQTDVLGELSAAAWGLVVVDEAHLVKGARARALSRIAQSAKRVILSTLPGLKLTDISENDETTVVEWERNSVQNEKGDPIYPGQTAILHEEHFRLSQKDLRLLKALTS
ncbi:MAG TPA: hypothetical protein VHL58_00020, partial [Thermoanaerobaculia bacterium]|nr:hypothetical protein [Thermoanaerobaculia bacterium]